MKINLAIKEEIKVGKAADNDVVMNHVSMEDHQCSILNGKALIDHSTSGTFVHTRSLEAHSSGEVGTPIEAKSQIFINKFVFTL